MATYKTTKTNSSSESSSQETTQSKSTSKNVLDEALLGTILSGLTGQMTQEEIAAYAENLLRPALNAGLEAANQKYETEKLTREQEIENLAQELSRSIQEQNRAYQQSMADVETAALARGMGRSSYTLDRLANQGNALAQAVRELTEENTRKSDQIQKQISEAARQSEETKSRLNADYASGLAAKIQELTQAQRSEQNSNYLTAVSASMGRETAGTSETTGLSTSSSKSSTTTASGKTGTSSSAASSKTGASSSSSSTKKAEDDVDAISGAAVSVKKMMGQ